MKEAIDFDNPNFAMFIDCFMKGASLQDIYVQTPAGAAGGFAVSERVQTADPATVKRRTAAAHRQFLRIHEHLKNIVEPVDRHIGLAGKKVLDFGCGTGALSIAMALQGAQVTGVDPTAVSLEAAGWRAKYFGCEDRFTSRLVGTAPGLPFEDRSFDLVILNSVMEFIPAERERYVLDFLRMIRPGGHLVISTENGLFPRDYYTRQPFPLFRRQTMIRQNLPYGSTWFELRRWIRQSPRQVRDLSVNNWFNSVDKLATRRQVEGRTATAALLSGVNGVVKNCCRAIGVPSDILLPYATYLFEVTA